MWTEMDCCHWRVVFTDCVMWTDDLHRGRKALKNVHMLACLSASPRRKVMAFISRGQFKEWCVWLWPATLITLVVTNDDKTNNRLIPDWKEKSWFSHSTIKLCSAQVIRHAEKVWVNISGSKLRSAANTLLGNGNILVSVRLWAELSWGFTAEAADNTLPAAAAAAAEVPGEEEQPWDRTQGACWSCDRSTYPWALPPEVRNELQELGSCIECSYHCCEENKSKYRNSTSANCEESIVIYRLWKVILWKVLGAVFLPHVLRLSSMVTRRSRGVLWQRVQRCRRLTAHRILLCRRPCWRHEGSADRPQVALDRPESGM